VGDATSVWFEAYAWDHRQRLTSVTRYNRDGGTIGTVKYQYDGLDRRIRRTEVNGSGTVTKQERFLYERNIMADSDSSSLLPRLGGEGGRRPDEGAAWSVVLTIDETEVAVTPSSPSATSTRVAHRYLNGPLLDQVFSDETSSGVLWYLQDHQMTVRDVATWAANHVGGNASSKEWGSVNHIRYDAFGNVTSADDPKTTASNDGALPGTDDAKAPQRSYTGREPDAATGLIYYRARWFDPKLGRFISEDPIGFAAGDANLSRYVGNSSPNTSDPSGLDDEFPLVPYNDQTWSLTIPAKGVSGSDIAAAEAAMRQANPGFSSKALAATWHHKSFDPATGEFVMELVDSAAHGVNHTGGFAEYLDWVRDTIANQQLGTLTDEQAAAILRTLRNDSLRKRIKLRLETVNAAAEIISERLTNGGHRIVVEAGEEVVEIVGKKSGRSIAATVTGIGAKGLPVVFILFAAGSAYAKDGTMSAACDAAARELTAADLVEGGVRIVAVEGGAIVMDQLVPFDEHVHKRFAQLPAPERDEYIRSVIRDANKVVYSPKAMQDIAAEYRERNKREGKTGFFDAFLYDVAIPAIEWLNGPL
jgi:RHS repeat-associated protein